MTFLAVNPDALAHDSPGHPETATRQRAIMDHVVRVPALRTLNRLAPDRPATDAELRSVHTQRLLLALSNAEASAPAWLDPDTYVVAGSEGAARLTARLALQAVERSLGRREGGFVAARPPGHHATADRSMGFCLYNNVALAAQHSLDTGRAQRVLVFDHDVHHGNGTQDIFYASNRVLYEGFHLSPHYPGTGGVDETGMGQGVGFTLNLPLAHGDGDAEVRTALHEVFLPVARSFRPDLVLVSAGFDSLAGDPLGGLALTPAFFGELVSELRALTPSVVAVLEGGYQLDHIPAAVEMQLLALSGAPRASTGPRRAPASLDALVRKVTPHWPILKASEKR